MRKKKENIPIAEELENAPDPEALAAEREQRFEEIDGETSTEGVGPAFTTEPVFEESIQTGDGPLSGDSIIPPTRPEGPGSRSSRKRKKRVHRDRQTRHAAEYSAKKI